MQCFLIHVSCVATLAAVNLRVYLAAYTFDGLVVFGLLVICTCAYMRRVPRLKQWFLSEKKGFWGVFYKASVIGTRLHFFVSVSCVLAGFYLVFIK